MSNDKTANMEIKTYNIPNDIKTLSATADKFPEGVKAAYEKLQTNIPDIQGRQMFGVAEPSDGTLIYRACAGRNAEDEPAKYHLQAYTIPKGDYLYLTLNDWPDHMDLFKKYFDKLLAHPDARKNSIGLEYYISSKDVMLMVQK